VDRLENPPPERPEREAGFSLIEIVFAAAIFATALMTTGLTLLQGARSQDESDVFTRAVRAVRDVCAEIQEQANLPQNLPLLQGIGAVYAANHGTTRAIADLPAGSISITCFANEATVPAILGGPQDMNFDGDDDDNLGGGANGSDMQIVPMVITVRFTDERGLVTQTYHRRFTQTTD
jgi:type II secretory pathway pseudopilin PulG